MFDSRARETIVSVKTLTPPSASPSLALPPFTPAPDGVDPASVPTQTLYTGGKIPVVGLGTFGSDHVTPQKIAQAVVGAACVGYRHFDCASVYANEREVGAALRHVMAGGVPRSELFITSKVWNDRHHDVVASCRQSLADLGLDYLDLYLVHWPFPNFHPPGCSIDSRSPDAKPFILDNYLRTWRQMEQLVDLGLVRAIGTSNMTLAKFKAFLPHCRVRPAVNEMELHPHFQQPELFDFVRASGMVPIGYCPVGSPNRPERDRTPDDTDPLKDPVVTSIAARLGVHPAFVCIKWAVQRGQVPIPFSTTRANYLANLRAAVTPPLSDADMTALSRIDRNCRFIKGHVFLWKENQTWEALWDLDGTIAT